MKLWFKREKPFLTAPGPSPWYLGAPSARIRSSRGAWSWTVDTGPTLAGVGCLKTPDEDVVLLLDFGCYVLPLREDRVLVWYESGREPGSSSTPAIRFLLLALQDLRPLADWRAAAEAMRAEKQKLAFEGGAPVLFELPTSVEEGTHAIAPPPAFLELPEVLALADYGSDASNGYDSMFRAVFALDFGARRVSVIPQRWYNEGGYDYGHQWVTRVQREEKTGRIVGEGIRLGRFRLDASGTRVQDWLHRDSLYHPEHEFLRA